MPLEKKRNLKFNMVKFADLISRKSNTQVIIVKNEKELCNFFKKNLTSNEIIIGMGAGLISKWITGLKFSMKNSNDLFNKFGSNLSHNVKLANYSWFNLEEMLNIFLNLKTQRNY